MKRFLFPSLLLTLPLALVQAQEAEAPVTPLYEYPLELRHAYAVDILGLQLDALESGVMEDDDDAEAEAADTEAVDTDAEEAAATDEAAEAAETGGEGEADAAAEAGEEGEEEEEEGILVVAMPLISGSLGATDEALLTELTEAFEAAETGDEAAVGTAREVLAQVESTLIPEDLAAETAFRAGRFALVAAEEPGVGEGYEEAAGGETEAYIIGYTGLQHLKSEWEAMSTEVDGDSEGIERAFGVLDGLMPTAELPERFSDPEDAEVAVIDILFNLEALTGTILQPRDFGEALEFVGTHASEACTSAEAGESDLAAEWAFAGAFFYEAFVERVVGMLAPEAGERIGGGLSEIAEDPALATLTCEDVNGAIEEASALF